MNHFQYNVNTIWKSFIVMAIIQIIPYPIYLFYLPKPSYLSLLLIYWVIKIPNHINIGSGFIIGLITDILSGPIIGIRSIILSSFTYLLIVKFPIFSNLPIWKQGLIVILFSFNTNLIIYLSYIVLINKIRFDPEIILNHISLNSITDGIIWIGITLIMNKINTK